MDRKKLKELQEDKAKFRQFFRGSLGHYVLGKILIGPCRFDIPASTPEIAARQSVAREILCLMDLWFGPGQSQSPQNFVSKLLRAEEVSKAKKEK